MVETVTAHDEALDLLRRDALRGRAGAANALERALRRKQKDEIYLKGRDAREEKRRRATTSRHDTDTVTPDDYGPAIAREEWQAHNADLACGCNGCMAYGRDLLAEILS